MFLWFTRDQTYISFYFLYILLVIHHSLKHWYLLFSYRIWFAQNSCFTNFPFFCLLFRWKYRLPLKIRYAKLRSISSYWCDFRMFQPKTVSRHLKPLADGISIWIANFLISLFMFYYHLHVLRDYEASQSFHITGTLSSSFFQV